MFQSTLSIGSREHPRGSTLLRGLRDVPAPTSTRAEQLAALSPSLAGDLKRFERDGIQTELVEVVAASLRHGRTLLVHVEYGERTLPLTLFPAQRLVHCPLPLAQLLTLRLTQLFVAGVEPATLQPPGGKAAAAPNERGFFGSLDALSWELAMRGARAELLPEIPAQAAYRVPPGATLEGITLTGTLASALHRMKRHATNLKGMSAWAGLDRERAMRLLNALYLRSALVATRTHPAADNDVFS